MLAVDTNILVYASRADLHFHSSSAAALESLVSSRRPWAIPWPCAHEFIATVTNRRIFGDPTPLDRAIDQLSAWREAGAIWLGEGVDHLGVLHRVAIAGHAEGPRIHDARIAAICLANRVSELWSADRDFTRFPELTVRNPLVG
jgi:toxin-antitoxin system PIN domain toxin